MTRTSRPRFLLLVVAIVLATSGCFALFSLDGYGPPGEQGDASLDGASGEASPSVDAAPRGRTIFVTSDTFTGDLGTRDGGDLKCEAVAVDAGLSGSYRVWLGDVQGSAVDSLVLDAGPLRLTNGTVVADDTLALVQSGPRAGIAFDERGRRVGAGGCEDGGLVAWTGTFADGGNPSMSGFDCSRWRGSGTQPGLVGLVGSTGAAWTEACTRQCGDHAALYCIQQ